MRISSENIELLMVRHLKRNVRHDGIIKRITAKYYALPLSYVDKDTIFNFLFDIIEKYDLLPHDKKEKNIRSFFINKESFEPYFWDMWDAWIYRARVVIRQSYISKFPRYPEPAYFRNRKKY